MISRPSRLPSLDLCLLALAGQSGVQRLRHWDSPWDILCCAPIEILQVSQASDLQHPSYQALLQTAPTTANASHAEEVPPFVSGWLGYVHYDFAALIEESLSAKLSGSPTLCFARYQACLAQYKGERELRLFAKTVAAAEALEHYLWELLEQADAQNPEARILSSIASSVSETAYIAAVESLKTSIASGAIFQANLSRELQAEWSQGQLAGFAERLLAKANPRFGYFSQWEDKVLVSLSPELHFKQEASADGWAVSAEPIKGTRPRHVDPIEDSRLSEELLNSIKDRAENIMIADLVRNDLSLVCEDNSIQVPQLCVLRSTQRVHHLQTRVEGRLKAGVSALQVLLAQFPCGSITGAPKWRSMELLAGLEQHSREVYCGSIGYIDDRGHACFSVAIRTLQFDRQAQGWRMRFGTGGGITTLSDAREEWLETIDKAADLYAAVERQFEPVVAVKA